MENEMPVWAGVTCVFGGAVMGALLFHVLVAMPAIRYLASERDKDIETKVMAALETLRDSCEGKAREYFKERQNLNGNAWRQVVGWLGYYISERRRAAETYEEVIRIGPPGAA